MIVKFREKNEIENEALNLLSSFEKKHGFIIGHVPIEEIIENHLKIHLEISELDNEDILGFIDFSENRIVINELIDPSRNSSMIGRFNYSLGHEIGHDVLHKETYLNSLSPEQDLSDSVILCRSSKQHESIEWQANYFSACLLMPLKLLYPLWQELVKGGKAIPITAFRQLFHKPYSLYENPEVLAEIALKGMAEKLQVSSQALRIRLKDIGFITNDSNSLIMQK